MKFSVTVNIDTEDPHPLQGANIEVNEAQGVLEAEQPEAQGNGGVGRHRGRNRGAARGDRRRSRSPIRGAQVRAINVEVNQDEPGENPAPPVAPAANAEDAPAARPVGRGRPAQAAAAAIVGEEDDLPRRRGRPRNNGGGAARRPVVRGPAARAAAAANERNEIPPRRGRPRNNGAIAARGPPARAAAAANVDGRIRRPARRGEGADNAADAAHPGIHGVLRPLPHRVANPQPARGARVQRPIGGVFAQLLEVEVGDQEQRRVEDVNRHQVAIANAIGDVVPHPGYEERVVNARELAAIQPVQVIPARPMCLICITREADRLMWPCCHYSYCDVCYNRLQFPECPVCRTRPVFTQKIYNAAYNV